jgi:hypothetical protein
MKKINPTLHNLRHEMLCKRARFCRPREHGPRSTTEVGQYQHFPILAVVTIAEQEVVVDAVLAQVRMATLGAQTHHSAL